MSPSRHERRSLERRADRLVARLTGMLVPVEADPRTTLVLLSEDAPPCVVRRERLGPALERLGISMPDLPEILETIEADHRDDGQHVPALVRIDSWVQIAFTRIHSLSRGGVA